MRLLRGSLPVLALAVLALAVGCASEGERPRHEGPPARVETVAPRPPRLLVDSVPSDAVVRVDGAIAGTTPVELETSGGHHAVSVSSPVGSREDDVNVAAGTPAVVVVTSWRARPALEARTPEELVRLLLAALSSSDRRDLDQLALTRDEIAAALGDGDTDQLRLNLLRRLDRDAAQLRDFGGWARARRPSVTGLEARRTRLSRDPFAREVAVVTSPTLRYDADGRRQVVRLGTFVRVGEGPWRVLSLLPAQTFQ